MVKIVVVVLENVIVAKKIQNKVLKLLTILTVTASINISSTLLFTYCNLSYIIAFLKRWRILIRDVLISICWIIQEKP